MRCFKLNTAGSGLIKPALSDPLALAGQTGKVVWDKANEWSKKALSYQVGGFHIGFVKEKGSPADLRARELLFEAVALGMPVVFTVHKAMYKDKDAEDKKKAWNHKGVGSFTHFELHVEVVAGCGDKSYKNDGKEYLRLTHMLGKFEWEDRSGLDQWMINRHRSSKDYDQAMYGYITEGQINHHKAEMRLSGLQLPTWGSKALTDELGPLVSDIPESWKALIDSVDEVVGIEQRVHDDVCGVAGTYDALVRIDGKLLVLDWKRNHSEKRQYKRQVAFYAKNTGAEGAIIMSAKDEGRTDLDADEMEKYYGQVCVLAEFVTEVGDED